MPESFPNSPPSRSLPQHPSLEQLRKQAKDLLDACRAQNPAAVAEIQRFERQPDPASFALSDAQRVLARAYGYASWPRLKAFVDGVNIRELADAVSAGDIAKARVLLNRRPELIGIAMAENNEHRAIHYAVLRRDQAMVRLLMEAGADARTGIYPHRDATSARTIAEDRGYNDILAVIDDEERLRREELSCPNATISPVQDQITAAISRGDNAEPLFGLLRADGTLIHACDRDGASALCISPRITPMKKWSCGSSNAKIRRQQDGYPRVHTARPGGARGRPAKRSRQTFPIDLTSAYWSRSSTDHFRRRCPRRRSAR